MSESEQMWNIEPAAGEPLNVVRPTSERIACRSERQADLARSSGPTFREVTTTRWILAGCSTCGLCADMLAR